MLFLRLRRNPSNQTGTKFEPDVIEANIAELFQVPRQKRQKLQLPKPIFSARTRPGLISIKGPPPYRCNVVPALVGQEHLLMGPRGLDVDYDKIDFLIDCKNTKLKSSGSKRVIWGRP